MRLRTVAGLVIAGVATGAAVASWRRRAATDAPMIRLGLGDGTAAELASDDPAAAELQGLAGGLRLAFEAHP